MMAWRVSFNQGGEAGGAPHEIGRHLAAGRRRRLVQANRRWLARAGCCLEQARRGRWARGK